MCLIIDTCCFARVFDSDNEEHSEFEPVLSWVTKGDGRVIYGGSKYKKELRKAHKYFSLLVELGRRGRVIRVDDGLVDSEEMKVKGREEDEDFDDPHLIALVIVSRCRIICTNDKRAHKFIKKAALYPKGISRPSIYSGRKNADLLTKKMILGVCA